ncbi:MAG: AraC family transcriptional regulator [Myxococcota bacterium]
MGLKRATLDDYQRRLLRAEDYLVRHLDEDIAPLEVASHAGFSLHHFHRVFRAQLGESLMAYLRRLRLERAARRLRSGDRKVVDLAFEAGYGSHEAFTRAFVEHFGMPPQEYRVRAAPPRVASFTPKALSAPITIRGCAETSLLALRHRGSFLGVGATFQRVHSWVATHRGMVSAAPALYGICHDDPDVTPEAVLRFDAAVEVEEGSDEGGLRRLVIREGTYAVALHRGPYTTLHETYLDLIGRWFPQSGYEPAPDAIVERYLNDPSCTAEADLETEVRVRLDED